jgi:hypothetical protein
MLSAERLNQRAPREGQHGPPLLACMMIISSLCARPQHLH